MNEEIIDDVVAPETTGINLAKIKNDLGEVIKISLTDDERKILTGFTKSPFFTDIILYLNQIILEGTISRKDANRIDDFIMDWTTNNIDQILPKPLQFLQMVIVPKINNEYVDQGQQNIYQQNTQQLPSLIDDDNVPSYISKINDLIEREVRRRVKVELKEYTELKLKHKELITKMEGISKMFSTKQ